MLNYEWQQNPETCIRAFEIENLNFHPHLHSQFEFVYVLRGKTDITIRDGTHTAHSGEMCIIPCNYVHSYRTNEDSKIFILIVDPSLITDFTNLFKRKKLACYFYKASTLHDDYVEAISKILNYTGQNKMVAQGFAYVLLGMLTPMLKFENKKPLEESSVEKILDYIEQNFESPQINLETLSRYTGISKYHISHLFHEKIGCNFRYYVNMMRINKAVRLLLTNMTITQISFECGYENIRSFNRAFREITGITPTGFRSVK